MDNNVKKHRFNFVDAIIILIILLVLALVAYIFLFSGSSKLFNRAGNMDIYYAVECPKVLDSVVLDLEKGDKVIDSIRGYDIGEVVAFYKGDSELISGDKDGNAVSGDYPYYSSVIVVIKARALKDKYDYSINGFDFQVGKAIYIRTKGLVSNSYCVAVTEDTSEAGLSAFLEKCENITFAADVKGKE